MSSASHGVYGRDMFEALVRLRRQLEPDGLRVAVQGRGVIPTPAAWRGIWAAACRSTSYAPDCPHTRKT